MRTRDFVLLQWVDESSIKRALSISPPGFCTERRLSSRILQMDNRRLRDNGRGHCIKFLKSAHTYMV